MEELLDKYLNRIIDVYQKKSLPPSNSFDLFDALGEAANENAFITEISSLTNDIEDIERRFVKDIMKHLH